MNRSGRLLCALYLATSGGLAWITVVQCAYGPAWGACLFAAASVVPVIGVVRETLIRDLYAAVAGTRRPAHPAADEIVREELEAACCERWWTSLGTDHDTGCPHRRPRSSAA